MRKGFDGLALLVQEAAPARPALWGIIVTTNLVFRVGRRMSGRPAWRGKSKSPDLPRGPGVGGALAVGYSA